MAHGQNAAANGHHREYWSRRPYSGIGWGRACKEVTHRIERHAEAPAAVAAGLADWRGDNDNHQDEED